jgi:hypothetical protein
MIVPLAPSFIASSENLRKVHFTGREFVWDDTGVLIERVKRLRLLYDGQVFAQAVQP